MRLSVSEGDWTAGWNGTAITVSRPAAIGGQPERSLTFSLRSVAVMKLVVSTSALLVATTDRKVLIWDLLKGTCVRLLAFKAAVTDIRTNGTVAGLVLEDLSLHFFKLGQLTAPTITDAK